MQSSIKLALALVASLATQARAQDSSATAAKLAGFDAYMNQVMRDWNVPGIGVGVVVKNKLVFARGFGYRDYGNKLPFTPTTVVPIASNTKLFTAIAMGLLVDEGKIDWDKPVRQFVPSVQFYNDELNASVNVRDMLAHRTGVTRHDMIWYKSPFTRRELFERLKYLEPSQPMRTTFLYNNLMYGASGYIIEQLSGKTWEQFVQTRIFQPLGMTSTVFSIDDVIKQPDHGVPFTERRDSDSLYAIPYYREQVAIGPAGAINSNIQDLSHWLIALMNAGRFEGRQVIPAGVVKATLEPSIAMPNTTLEAFGWGELLNAAYGMGRWTASYRGHLLAYHGGDINGFHSQVSYMPSDSVGVIVLVIGDHAAPLYNVVSYNVYERLLGLEQTPWSQRLNDARKKAKQAGMAARAQAGGGQVKGTRPSHALDDFVGEFENQAYGVVAISKQGAELRFSFHQIDLPLTHFHYDRFDTPDDEANGKWSVNFGTNPQGEIDKAVMSLDQAEVAFVRRVPSELTAPATLRQYAGTYVAPSGASFEVVLKEDGTLGIEFPGQPLQALVPWRQHRFKLKEFSDITIEFVVEGGKVKAMTQISPSGRYTFPRR
ncbi:MAG TPA: serine hydrolase [Gemmatimonadales bacterium]|jgi:CubicO group peptidase (beta-lactamase class C family)|nr:serine hydrolase [Gemmatimonadales bacterium]